MICRASLLAYLLLFSYPALAAEPVYTTQTRFRIPYESDPAELARLQAREVRLYVSSDEGRSWTLSQSVAPSTGRFTFEAPADGEYWFAVRTVDGAGRLYPPTGAGLNAGLKVIVDSRKPSLELTLDRQGDQIELSWNAQDADLAAETLVIETRDSAGGDWKALPLAGRARGQTSWAAPEKGTVAARGSVEDRAGNRATATEDLLIQEAGYAPLPERPDLEGPIAKNDAKEAVQAAKAETDKVKGRLVSRQETRTSIAERKPVEAPTRLARAIERDALQSAQKPAAQEPSASAKEIVKQQPAETVPDGAEPQPNTPKSAAPGSLAMDDPSGAQLVGARKFDLGYRVDEVGPSGVGSVEFFITEDDGRTWYRYGTDPDRQSPFGIQVPREGTYGFLVRVRSGVGLGESAPRPGEEPAFRVVVDETPPQVTLAPPTQHTSATGPVVRVRWQARDPHPGREKSVDIAYAESASGPWTPIASGIDDTGQYDWRTEGMPGGRLYLRVTARDAAGNLGQGTTAEPVIVDFVRPTARITDVEVRAAE